MALRRWIGILGIAFVATGGVVATGPSVTSAHELAHDAPEWITWEELGYPQPPFAHTPQEKRKLAKRVCLKGAQHIEVYAPDVWPPRSRWRSRNIRVELASREECIDLFVKLPGRISFEKVHPHP